VTIVDFVGRPPGGARRGASDDLIPRPPRAGHSPSEAPHCGPRPAEQRRHAAL